MNWGAHKADVRVAAKNSVTMRAALRASINARAIYNAYQDTHPFVTDNITQDRTRARAWAMLHVKIDNEPIAGALKKIYADGFLLGLDASAEAIGQAKTEYNKAAITKAKKKEESPDYVDWNNWKPGNRAAALLYRPTGAFEKLLNNAGINSKKIAANGFDRIGTALADSIAAGFSPARAAKVITEKIGDPARALTIAITEQNRAMSLAAMENYQNGGVEKVEWSGANPCEICAPNEGQVIALGDNFNSGDTEPPVHPNCRCAVLPVIDEAYYAETSNEGLDLMPMEEAAPREFNTEQEMFNFAKAEQGKIPRTDLAAKSIGIYQSDRYVEINNGLRAKTPLTEQDALTRNILDTAIKKSSFSKDVIAYRGIADDTGKVSTLQIGAEIKDLGFTSTTMNPKVAEAFANGVMLDRGAPVVLKITIPKGSPALAADVVTNPTGAAGLSAMDAEIYGYSNLNEIVLPRNTTLIITGKEYKDQTTYFTAKMVPK